MIKIMLLTAAIVLVSGCASTNDPLDALDRAAAMGLTTPACQGPAVRVDPFPTTTQFRTRTTRLNNC